MPEETRAKKRTNGTKGETSSEASEEDGANAQQAWKGTLDYLFRKVIAPAKEEQTAGQPDDAWDDYGVNRFGYNPDEDPKHDAPEASSEPDLRETRPSSKSSKALSAQKSHSYYSSNPQHKKPEIMVKKLGRSLASKRSSQADLRSAASIDRPRSPPKPPKPPKEVVADPSGDYRDFVPLAQYQAQLKALR
mgnify:CR=1 FL=1